MAEQPDYKKQSEDLLKSNKLSAATKKNFQDQLNLLTQQGAQAELLKALYNAIGDSIDSVRDDLTYITSSFRDALNDLSKQNSYLTIQKSALSKISDIAKKTLDIRRGDEAFDSKKIAKLKLETTKQLELLNLAKTKGDFSSEEKLAIEKQIDAVNGLSMAFDAVVARDKELNKQLGLGPKLAGGIDKALSKLGLPELGLSNALEETKKLGQEAASQGEEATKNFSAWKTYTGLVGGNLKKVFSVSNLIQGSVFLLLDTLMNVDKGAGDLAKGFNMTYTEANRTREQLTQMGNSSGDIALNTRALQESMMAVGKSLGSNAQLNEKDLKTFTKLREQAGFTNDELEGMQKLTLATGGNLEDNTSKLLYAAKTTALNNKVLLNEKDIMREVSKASKATQLSLSGNPEALGKAAAQAKALGMNLEQVDKIANSMLDFESSISSELEAELLTGKQLNLEKAREYALNNDMEGLSKEIAKNFGTGAEFSKMNRIQQEAAAKAVGMSREELANTLVDQQALKGLSGAQAEDAKAALADARARGMSEADIQKQGIDGLMQQQSTQERLTMAVEKMKEAFVSIAEPLMAIISPIVDVLSPVLSIISSVLGDIVSGFKFLAPLIETIVGMYAVWYGWQNRILIKQKASALLAAVEGWWGSEGSIPIIGAGLALAGIAATGAYINSIKDGAINPQGGLVVSGEKGSIQLDKQDSIIAGTNLGGKGGSNSNSSSTTIDMSGVINELAAVKQILSQILAKEGNIHLDGTKVGTALNVGTARVQ